ncbi:MAG: hypothetical protein ACI841_004369 [Planctomycetota bacterium]|jgi:hypothetical protein
MNKKWLWSLAKTLELAGLIVVLVGLLMSINLGLGEKGLASMASEFQGLMVGGGLFFLGYLLERISGTR